MHNRLHNIWKTPEWLEEAEADHFEEFNEVDWAKPDVFIHPEVYWDMFYTANDDMTFDFSMNGQELVEFIEEPSTLRTVAEMIAVRNFKGFPLADELTFFRN